MEKYNNWMWFSFDSLEPNKPKQHKESKFQIHFNKNYVPQKLTYQEALFRNAALLKDIYNGPFDVMLSGGIDSEVVVRTFHHLKIKQNVYTFRFENDYNILDVTNAIKICKDIGIKLNLIDFNLKKFFENDAEKIYKISYTTAVEKLVRFAWYDFVDNIPVFGDGEPYWVRDKWDDFSTTSSWSMFMFETDWAHAVYSKAIKRIVIGEWYNFTPEIWLSFMDIDYIQKLTNDEIKGKLSSWSYRTTLHRQIWPDIFEKPKLIGYEGDQVPSLGRRPEFMENFAKEMIQKKESKFRFTREKLLNIFNKEVEINLYDEEYFQNHKHILLKNSA